MSRKLEVFDTTGVSKDKHETKLLDSHVANILSKNVSTLITPTQTELVNRTAWISYGKCQKADDKLQNKHVEQFLTLCL